MSEHRIPSDADDTLGALIHGARASRSTKLTFLLGGAGAILVAGVLWPEFRERFGGFVPWILTLRYNPGFAAPGLILILAIVAAVWAILRLGHYSRLRVEVRERGIRTWPGPRDTAWEDIEDLRLAERRVRGGAGLLRVSLQLRPRAGRPIDLSHRFDDMQALIGAVRRQVEPRLIEAAVAAVELDGQTFFGPLVTVRRDGLLLGHSQREIALERVESCGVREGQFSVLEHGAKMVFGRSSELIPNATIIGAVVERVREQPRV